MRKHNIALESSIKEIRLLISRSKQLSTLFDKILETGSIFIFGGIIRDTYASISLGLPIKAADIDFVVDTNRQLFHCPKGEVNSFGGIKCSSPALPIPINYWRLQDTYAMRKMLIQPKIENLTKTTVFDINAIAFEFTSSRYWGDLFLKAFSDRTISFNCTDYLYDFPELQAFRAFLYSQKLGFRLAQPVNDFIQHIISTHTAESFSKTISHFSKGKDIKNVHRFLRFAKLQ